MGPVSATKVIDLLPALLRYARFLTRDEAAAEDLVQDALVAAYANADRYQRGRPLRVWLFAILHNRFVSGTRRQATRERHLAEAAQHEPPVAPAGQEAALRLREIEVAVATLSADHREALHLVAVEGLSYQDAAAAIGVPIGTLISRLSRARARLREIEDGPRPAAARPPERPVPLRIVKDRP